MTDRHSEDPEYSAISRRRLVKYAGVGATLAAASPLLGVNPAAADDEDDRKAGQSGNSRHRVWRAA